MSALHNHSTGYNAVPSGTISAIIVCEDRQLAYRMQQSLLACRCHVSGIFATAAQALEFSANNRVDFAVIDLAGVRPCEGVETAESLRRLRGIPPVFVSAAGNGECDEPLLRVEPLGYLTRPINDVQVGLVVNLARRFPHSSAAKVEEAATGYRRLGMGYAYHHELRCLYHNGNPVDLTPGERDLFDLCLRREGTVVPYETIIAKVWNGKAVAESTRRGLYHRLRSKLGGRLFETVSGIGCRVRLSDRLAPSCADKGK